MTEALGLLVKDCCSQLRHPSLVLRECSFLISLGFLAWHSHSFLVFTHSP